MVYCVYTAPQKPLLSQAVFHLSAKDNNAVYKNLFNSRISKEIKIVYITVYLFWHKLFKNFTNTR